jgi:uncharacterized membrane protein YbhN (UPF0104 family)
MKRPTRYVTAAVLGGGLLLAVGVLALNGASPKSIVEPLLSLKALGQLDPLSLLAAISCSVVAILINGVVWSRLLARLGYTLPAEVGLGVFLSADLAGLVANMPGSAVGSAVTLRRHGVCSGRAVVLTLIANLLGFCSILVWVPVGILLLMRSGMARAVPFLGDNAGFSAACLLACAIAAALIALRALAGAGNVGPSIARRLLRQASSTVPAGTPPLRFRHLLALIPWSGLSWLAGALALYAVLGALAPDRSLNLGDVVGSAALAAMLGSLAFFIPAGLGVRDGALIALLMHSTGLSLATCTEAAIALRVMDPVTKVGVLFLLAAGLPRALRRLGTWLRAACRRPVPLPRPVPIRVTIPVWIAPNEKK